MLTASAGRWQAKFWVATESFMAVLCCVGIDYIWEATYREMKLHVSYRILILLGWTNTVWVWMKMGDIVQTRIEGHYTIWISQNILWYPMEEL